MAAEIFPFLGSSRLENPINQFNVSVVFHGHAHNGMPSGKTSTQVPVFNVALPVISRKTADELPLLCMNFSAPRANLQGIS